MYGLTPPGQMSPSSGARARPTTRRRSGGTASDRAVSRPSACVSRVFSAAC
jgi:hypothetical protein